MSLQEKFDKAKELPESGRADAFKAIVLGSEGNDAEGLKVKEAAITEICSIYVTQANGEALRALLVELRPLFAAMPKVPGDAFIFPSLSPLLPSLSPSHPLPTLPLTPHPTFPGQDSKDRPLDHRRCGQDPRHDLPPAGHVQGAGRVGPHREAVLPQAADRAQAGDALHGDKGVPAR